jgi:hypothetical protein
VLNGIEAADMSAAGERAAPRGLLTITAAVMFGTRILRARSVRCSEPTPPSKSVAYCSIVSST